jgi:hypothetical protein
MRSVLILAKNDKVLQLERNNVELCLKMTVIFIDDEGICRAIVIYKQITNT